AHSRLGIFEFHDLAIELLRQVMRGDGVHEPFRYGLTKDLRRGFIAQWRIDLQVGIVLAEIGIGKIKMVRRNRATDLQTGCFCLSDALQRAGGTDAGEMELRAGIADELDVP